jgi:dTDP-L-rhamnose 4-epimerase
MKKILITGGAGFIGSNLCLKLVEKNYEVTVIDSLSEQIHGSNPLINSALYNSVKDKIVFIYDTILNSESLEKAIGDNEIIVHLAAETGTGQSMYDIHNYVNVNSTGTALLLDILANKKNSVKKLIVSSSRALYGEGKYLNSKNEAVYPLARLDKNMEKGIFDLIDLETNQKLKLLATDELSKIHPSSVYGITKQNQEDLIMTVCPTIGISSVALRYQNVYGAGQSLKNPYTGILSIFSNLIRQYKPINIFEDGLESRDFVYIDDVVDATILAIENEKSNNQIFNVGTGRANTVIEVAQTLIKNYSITVDLNITGNYRLGDIRHNFADITKIKSMLGFMPKVSFETGIDKFTKWVLSQEVEQDLYEKSLMELKSKGLLK